MNVLDKTITQLTLPTPFAIGDVHVYLIRGDRLTLVDAGVKTKSAWEELKRQLRSLGYFPKDIEQIILTHHHPDHTGLIEEFPRLDDLSAHKHVDVWIKQDELFLEQYAQFFKSYFTTCGVPQSELNFIEQLRGSLNFAGKGILTSTLQEDDTIKGHEDWRVIDTKGHAQSHISLFKEKNGVFIGGDHLLHHVSSNPLLEAPYDSDGDLPKPLLQYRDNLTKCLTLGIKQVLPGHGVIFSDVERLIPIRLKRQENFANKVYLMLKKQPLTPYQICQQLYPQQYRNQLDLTMSETIGQLHFLESIELIESREEDGRLFYKINKVNK